MCILCRINVIDALKTDECYICGRGSEPLRMCVICKHKMRACWYSVFPEFAWEDFERMFDLSVAVIKRLKTNRLIRAIRPPYCEDRLLPSLENLCFYKLTTLETATFIEFKKHVTGQ